MAPTTAEIDRMLTEKEAGALIGMQAQTMAKWRMSGNPKAPAFVKIGRSCRYKLSTLKTWMDNQQDRFSNHQAAA
jgi:hypothetical protein